MCRLLTLSHLLEISLLVGMLVMAGCSSQRYDRTYRHENFKASMAAMVGHNYDKFGGGWTNPKSLVSTTVLPKRMFTKW